MSRKRFNELTVLNIWIVPATAFWLCAVGFVGGVLAEKNSDPKNPLIPPNVTVLGIPIHAVQGVAAIAM
jgi:hypothetical protein